MQGETLLVPGSHCPVRVYVYPTGWATPHPFPLGSQEKRGPVSRGLALSPTGACWPLLARGAGTQGRTERPRPNLPALRGCSPPWHRAVLAGPPAWPVCKGGPHAWLPLGHQLAGTSSLLLFPTCARRGPSKLVRRKLWGQRPATRPLGGTAPAPGQMLGAHTCGEYPPQMGHFHFREEASCLACFSSWQGSWGLGWKA